MNTADFIVGANEPMPSGLLRCSIVWVGIGFGESALGLPPTHPLCLAALRVQAAFGFSGNWISCAMDRSRSEHAQRRAALELARSGWTIVGTGDGARGQRAISPDRPWPFDQRPGLSHAMRELLILGEGFDLNAIECGGHNAHRRPILGEELVFDERVSTALATSKSVAVCFGRTHVDASPGFSILSWTPLDPEAFVPPEFSAKTLTGAAAAKAWSYRRRTP